MFNCLNDLVKDIQGINRQECIDELANMRKGTDAISSLRQIRDDTNDSKENVRKVIDMQNEQQENRRIQLEKIRRKKQENNKRTRYRLNVFLVVCTFLPYHCV